MIELRLGLTRLDVEVKELVRLEERELDVSFVVENNDVVVAAPVCASASIEENGYGSSEVVRLVVQQSGPPRPCPGNRHSTSCCRQGRNDSLQ